MVRTQIQFTEEQSRRLKLLAARSGIPVTELIRRSVEKLLKASTGLYEDQHKRRAIEAAGKLHSGLKDISLDHDKYLTEAYSE